MWQLLKKVLAPRRVKPKGILLYPSVQEVICAQKLLQSKNFSVRLVAPPAEVRLGCDLAIEFDLLEQEALEAAAKEYGRMYKIISSKEMLPDILKRTVFVEFDGFLMCRAGNMKITIDKNNNEIVNISGGGCPDIPYVAEKLYKVNILQAPDPITIGSSLCAYLLQIAFDALKEKVKL
jgi:hypothetical protein